MTTLLLALGGIAAAPIAQAGAAPDPTASGAEFFGLLNQTRAGNARAELSRDPGLDALALAWSTHMADVYDATGVVYTAGVNDCSKIALCHRPDLTHGLDVIEPNWQGGAENIGVGGDVQSLHNALVSSPGHFANMIGNYNRVGVGVVVRGDRMWVTFDFLLGPAVPVASRLSSPPPTGAVTAIGGQTTFMPVDPVRVLDTRSGTGRGAAGAISAGSTVTLDLSRVAGEPASARGAALNVTVNAPTTDGFLTVYPCSSARPMASNVNFSAGETVPNLVDVALGSGGQVCLFSSASTHLVADLSGWFVAGSDGSSLTTRSPVRVLDTRSGDPIQEVTLSLDGLVPAAATAVAMNVTVTGPARAGFLTVHPCGSARPTASNLNYDAGQTVPNLVTVRVGVARSVCVFSSSPTHVLVDLAGWFGPRGGGLTPVVPARLLDTRDGKGGWLGRLGAGQEIDLALGGHNQVPSGTSGVVLNVTVTDADGAGYLTVYPCGTSRPTASNLNYGGGSTRANLVVVQLSSSGSVCFYASSRASVVVDLAAYVTPVV